MTVHFETLHPATLYTDVFGVPAPDAPMGRELWPRQPGLFVHRAQGEAAASEPALERRIGQFGLVPRWVKSASDAKLRSPKLVNARSETVTTSNNLREAWLAGQRCIVPMQAFFEEDWRSGKAVSTRIARVDG